MFSLPPKPTPEDFEKLFTDGCRAHQFGELREAGECYQLLLKYLPDSSILHYNLGLVHYKLSDFRFAHHQFELALIENSEDSDTLFNLALCHAALGEHLEAAGVYERILTHDPQNTDCLYNLGGCCRKLGEDEQAIACYRQVLLIDANYVAAMSNLAYMYHSSGSFDLAEPLYRALLSARPADESARFMLDSLTGEGRDCAPDEYVRGVFDKYAQNFEQNLVAELGYDNPAELFLFVSQLLGVEAKFERGLDLGCGTGLSGLPFTENVQFLDGVDLSGKMLAQADGKGIYAQLYQSSIKAFLGATEEHYNLLIATDVFIYVGALEELLQSAFEVAAPAACFCFSTEELDGEDGYRLRTSGRFAYSGRYIRRAACDSGWTVLGSRKCRLRRERGSWIGGELWLLQRLPPVGD